MKKFLAFFLALVMVFGLCACGGKSGNEGGSGVTEDGKVKLVIGIPSNALVLSHDDNAYTRWIEEKCGVELSFQEFAGGTDVQTQISTTIAARQDLPDILWGISLNTPQWWQYGKEGYFVDLTPYYEDKEGASKVFWDRFNNELSEAEQKTVMREMTCTDTGNFYGAPSVETSAVDKQAYQMWINTQWLDTLGLEMPNSVDSLYTVLKAFKDGDPNGNGVADEIPLFGSQDTDMCGLVVDWIINMFTYYNRSRPYHVEEDGTLTLAYTKPEYREALKFVNKLREEGLIPEMVWSNADMKSITTPSSGTALCGIFAGHLTSHTITNNMLLEQYAPLPYWGSVVRREVTCSISTFVTDSCDNPDKAFEVLMAAWSWDGSMRSRYGEYGVNWTDADPGAKSDMGLDATYKLISDPLKVQGTQKWAKMGPVLNIMAEGETAQIADEMSEWAKLKSRLHAESYQNMLKAEEEFNPKKIVVGNLGYTKEENDRTSTIRTNVGDRASKAQTEFMTGILDPDDDATWNAYLAELDQLGMDAFLEVLNDAYKRNNA